MIVNILCDYSLCLSDQLFFVHEHLSNRLSDYKMDVQVRFKTLIPGCCWPHGLCGSSSFCCQRQMVSSVIVQHKTSERTTLMNMYELLHLRRLEWGNGACESILTVWGNSTVSTKLLPVVDWITAHKMLPLSSDDTISDNKMLTLSSSSWSCCLCSGAFESVKRHCLGVTAVFTD